MNNIVTVGFNLIDIKNIFYRVIDLNGRVVLTGRYANWYDTKFTINFNKMNLSDGLYMLEVNYDDKYRSVNKFVLLN